MRILATLILAFSCSVAAASLYEIEQIVKESIEDDFNRQRRDVDLTRLYYDKRTTDGDIMTVKTSVWGQEGFTNGWGWHRCTTEILIEDEDRYIDQGTTCFFDPE